jgi:hypothetical protein
MGIPRTSLYVLALCAVVGGLRPASGGNLPVCGNGIVEGNEICDGQECCTASCTIALNGTPCGTPAGACQLASACFDFTCFAGDALPDGAPCDDGDPCTVGETCQKRECVPQSRRCTVGVVPTITPANTLFRGIPGSVAATVDCNVPGGAGGTCSAAAFLPLPPATGAPNTAAVAGSQNDLSCDFTRQITRSASRPLDDAGMAHIKLKLNKLARRLLRKLPVSDMVSLTVCTKIDFPNGDSITLVDVVNAARQ